MVLTISAVAVSMSWMHASAGFTPNVRPGAGKYAKAQSRDMPASSQVSISILRIKDPASRSRTDTNGWVLLQMYALWPSGVITNQCGLDWLSILETVLRVADQAATLILFKLLDTGPEHILLLVDDQNVRAQCGRYIDDVDAGSCGAVNNADLVRVVPCTQKCPCR